MRFLLTAVTLAFSYNQAALALPIRCAATVLRDTKSDPASSYVLKRGAAYGPVTELQVNPKNGRATYCAHGSSCYPVQDIEISRCIFVPDATAPVGDDDIMLEAK